MNRINGNAVYNVTYPLLNLLTQQLEDGAGTKYNTIPYDYRISQMLIEGSLRIIPEIPKNNASKTEDSVHIDLQSNMDKFIAWNDMFMIGSNGQNNLTKETGVISNYAATNMVPEYIGGEKIIHGANMHSALESDKEVRNKSFLNIVNMI